MQVTAGAGTRPKAAVQAADRRVEPCQSVLRWPVVFARGADVVAGWMRVWSTGMCEGRGQPLGRWPGAWDEANTGRRMGAEVRVGALRTARVWSFRLRCECSAGCRHIKPVTDFFVSKPGVAARRSRFVACRWLRSLVPMLCRMPRGTRRTRLCVLALAGCVHTCGVRRSVSGCVLATGSWHEAGGAQQRKTTAAGESWLEAQRISSCQEGVGCGPVQSRDALRSGKLPSPCIGPASGPS